MSELEQATVDNMNMILDYNGNAINRDTAVMIAGPEPRWADPSDDNVVRISGNNTFSYALEDATASLIEGGYALVVDATYVEFNDVYTLEEPETLQCGTPFIRSCGGHQTYRGVAYDPEELGSCENCGCTMLCEDMEDDMCSDCYCDNDYDSDPTCIQSYHEHGLQDTIVIHKDPDPGLRKRHLLDYTIGFEVEKNHNGYDKGDEVPDGPLFAYWETDGSCGIEGITHAYSLGSSRVFSQHVMASRPALALGTDERCGGHLSIKGLNMTKPKVRQYIGLYYTLHRKRLLQYYCCADKRMNSTDSYTKYETVHRRGPDFLEFRLPGRVRNATQLHNRFEFFRILVDAVHRELTFDQYLRGNAKLLKEIYPDKERRRKIYQMAHHFQDWVLTGANADESIRRYTT